MAIYMKDRKAVRVGLVGYGLGGSTFHAPLITHFEPFRTAFEHLHGTVTGHDVEYRKATAGASVQLEIRRHDEHLQQLPRATDH